MRNTVYIIFSLLITLLLSSCGEGIVDIGADNYQSKIVVEGYLSPEHNVENIIIGRNFPLNTTISVEEMFIMDADVKITAIETGKEYKLQFDPVRKSYYYSGNDLIIGYNKSYSLAVSATIDGKILTTTSITTTPLKGFCIDKNLSTLGEMYYREKDQNGNLKNFNLVFNPSPQNKFYAISIVSMNAAIDKFIFDNPYNDVDTNDVKDDLVDYQYQDVWISNLKTDALSQSHIIEWVNTWFYGQYRTIMYAGDSNFKDYYITMNQLQEMDGNYHEPKLHLDGDGVGVFGSYIADTVYFTIKK
jgi:hypothetical protein